MRFDHGELFEYRSAFLDGDRASGLFTLLRERTEWEQRSAIWGKMMPRLTAWYSPLAYTYGGQTHPPKPFPDHIQAILQDVQRASGTAFDSLLLNLYRDGSDSVDWHDDSKDHVPHSAIASLSLGASRVFKLRTKDRTQSEAITLNSGDLVIMGGTFQEHWQHAVPKRKNVDGERINLTFRRRA
jgi:alkylated DNA repair dioxygenase AlkB